MSVEGITHLACNLLPLIGNKLHYQIALIGINDFQVGASREDGFGSYV
jgi:hypothetical protein